MRNKYFLRWAFLFPLAFLSIGLFQNCKKDPPVYSIIGNWQLVKIELPWGGGTDASDSTRSNIMYISEDSMVTITRDGVLLNKSRLQFKESYYAKEQYFFDSEYYSGVFLNFDANQFTLYNSALDGPDYYFERK